MLMNRGFSLVELSIVLVILGLLTGGILAGQSLIRAAELRTIPRDISKYQTAAMTFRDKYFALPGDFSKAVDFWGAAGGNATDNYTTTCSPTSGTGTQTCNGNSNGQIDCGTPECYRIWQHLANAGLIEGTYAGIDNVSTPGTLAGYNAPKAKVGAGNAAYGMQWGGTATSDPTIFDGNYQNIILYGGFVASASPRGAAIKPEEAWNIDTKMDDGRPGFGNVTSYKQGNAANQSPNCTTTNVASTSNYALTTASNECALIVKAGY